MNSNEMKNLGINEVYLLIDGFINYSVSNYGNVKNIKTDRILKPNNNNKGYYYVSLFQNNKSRNKTIHRLVLNAFENNYENKKCVDHINNNRSDNCLFNLRYATHQENNFNSSICKNNTSGVKGVSFDKQRNKWRAQIKINGKSLHLGYFNNIEDAKEVRQLKANEIFGLFINKCEL